MPLKKLTKDQIINQLDSGHAWSGQNLTYSFPKNVENMVSYFGEAKGFDSFTQTQQKFARLAMTSWDDLIKPDFEEIENGPSDIEFGNTTLKTDIAGLGYYPNDGSIWIFTKFEPSTDRNLKNPTIGNWDYSVYLHEIGHTLGLDHMGDYGGAGNWKPKSYQDSHVYSLMSYFGPNSGSRTYPSKIATADWVNDNGYFTAQTPMLSDILASQSIYGIDEGTRTGKTVYGFSSNISGAMANIFDFSKNKNPILTIFDSAGNDTLDLSGWNSDSVIKLKSGSFSSCNEMTFNIAIAYSCTIENAAGGGGNDTIFGNEVANALKGNSGNDRLFGGDGADIISGGSGSDGFLYQRIRESGVTSEGRDTIVGFSSRNGDVILLSEIDANQNRSGDQDFEFMNQKAFTGKAGELRVVHASGDTLVLADVDGDRSEDFSILLRGKLDLAAHDFDL
jgi:serralysin